MLPSRPPAPATTPGGPKSGLIAFAPQSYDGIKKRVLAKLEDRLNLSASKRMPQSLLRQTLRQQAEQHMDLEGRGLAKADRERMVEELLAELLGYGPLEELLSDPTVREVMVLGPDGVIVRREQAQWLPTSVTFRDEAHVRGVLDKIAAHAEAVGPVMASVSTFDMKLPNGFRVLAVIPPEVLSQAAMVAFVRETPVPVPVAKPASGTTAATAPRTPGSGLISTPTPRPQPAKVSSSESAIHGRLARHRQRILELLFLKFSRMGLYDASKLDTHELEKIVAAYVTEYAQAESIYLDESEKGQLTLDIVSALKK